MIKYPYIENNDNIFIENCDSIFIISGSGKEFELINVIRCKDCKNVDTTWDFLFCDHFLKRVEYNDFCSWAERRKANAD